MVFQLLELIHGAEPTMLAKLKNHGKDKGVKVCPSMSRDSELKEGENLGKYLGKSLSFPLIIQQLI